MTRRSCITWVSGACVFLGLILAWPVALLGLLGAAFFGRAAYAILFALILDIFYGAPPALGHDLLFPFTACAALAILLSISVRRYMR